jgi:hypothetical protein
VIELGDRRGEGNALWNIGLALYELRERLRQQYAKQALEIYEQIEDPRAAQVRAALAALSWGTNNEMTKLKQ